MGMKETRNARSVYADAVERGRTKPQNTFLLHSAPLFPSACKWNNVVLQQAHHQQQPMQCLSCSASVLSARHYPSCGPRATTPSQKGTIVLRFLSGTPLPPLP